MDGSLQIVVLLLVLVGALVTGAVLRARRQSPGEVAKRLVHWMARGEHQRRWERLHPVQRALIPVDEFVAAESEALFPRYTSLRVISESDWKVTVPAVGERIVREVKVQAWYGERYDTLNILLANVAGTWYWMVDQSTLDAYRDPPMQHPTRPVSDVYTSSRSFASPVLFPVIRSMFSRGYRVVY
jgi:hypothetical protein